MSRYANARATPLTVGVALLHRGRIDPANARCLRLGPRTSTQWHVRSRISRTADVRRNHAVITFVSDVLAEIPLLGADGQETFSLLLKRPGMLRWGARPASLHARRVSRPNAKSASTHVSASSAFPNIAAVNPMLTERKPIAGG